MPSILQKSCFILCLFCASLPALAAPPVSFSTPVSAETKKATDDIAVALIDRNRMFSQVDPLIKAIFDAMGANNPSFALLEKDFPGMTDNIIQAMRPIMLKEIDLIIPQYRAEISAFYAQKLTAVEARQVADFWISSVGQNFIVALNNNMKFDSMANDYAAKEAATPEGFRKDAGMASIKTISALGADERKAILGFITAPTGRKLMALNVEKNKIDIKWSNYASPQAIEDIQKVVIDAMAAFIQKSENSPTSSTTKLQNVAL